MVAGGLKLCDLSRGARKAPGARRCWSAPAVFVITTVAVLAASTITPAVAHACGINGDGVEVDAGGQPLPDLPHVVLFETLDGAGGRFDQFLYIGDTTDTVVLRLDSDDTATASGDHCIRRRDFEDRARCSGPGTVSCPGVDYAAASRARHVTLVGDRRIFFVDGTPIRPFLVQGPAGNDTLIGSDGDDEYIGNAGNDIASGGAGDDSMQGDLGDDSVDAGEGDDVVVIDAGQDELTAGPGDDVFDFLADLGPDLTADVTANGDAGADTIAVRSVAIPGSPTVINLAERSAADGSGRRATLSSVENVDGGVSNDEIVGDDGANRLRGESALFTGLIDGQLAAGIITADQIDALPLEDTLTGGPGEDELVGGYGDDTFVADDGEVDQINCGEGDDSVQADADDVVSADCERRISAVVITSGPSGTVASDSAHFEFGEVPDAEGTLECRLDGGSFSTCTSPQDYTDLSEAEHVFEVRFDPQGPEPASPVTERRWTVELTRPSVSGTRFRDADRDGQRDPDEPGLSGWRIYLDENATGQFEAGEPSALTADNGTYKISDIPKSATPRTVRMVSRNGWDCSLPNPCEYTEVLNDTDERTGRDFGGLNRLSIELRDFTGQDQVEPTAAYPFTFRAVWNSEGCGNQGTGEGPLDVQAYAVSESNREQLEARLRLPQRDFEAQANSHFQLPGQDTVINRTTRNGSAQLFERAVSTHFTGDGIQGFVPGSGVFLGGRIACKPAGDTDYDTAKSDPSVLCRNQSRGDDAEDWNGLTATMQDRLTALFAVLDQNHICYALSSGFRSIQDQQRLYDRWHDIADRRPGDNRTRDLREICRQVRAAGFLQCPTGWNRQGVARNGPGQPGRSRHNHGEAADLRLGFGATTGEFAISAAQRRTDVQAHFNALVAQVDGLCGSPARDPGHIELPYVRGQDVEAACHFVDPPQQNKAPQPSDTLSKSRPLSAEKLAVAREQADLLAYRFVRRSETYSDWSIGTCRRGKGSARKAVLCSLSIFGSGELFSHKPASDAFECKSQIRVDLPKGKRPRAQVLGQKTRCRNT